MGVTRFDPLSVLIRLDGEARIASPMPRSVDSWRVINRASGERVMGMSTPRMASDLHPDKWEMHPHGDEILYLLEGAIDVSLDAENGEELVPLRVGEGCLIASGIWHRLLLRAPSRLLFVTPAGGTRMRPWKEGA